MAAVLACVFFRLRELYPVNKSDFRGSGEAPVISIFSPHMSSKIQAIAGTASQLTLEVQPGAAQYGVQPTGR